MPLTHEWQSRIKGVEKQYEVVFLATDRLKEQAGRDQTILPQNMKQGQIITALESLEGTYIIRLFAEFETGLRLYWETIRTTHPRTRGLLEGVAAVCKISDQWKNNAHSVREYRNILVHEREQEEDEEAIPISVARGYLCSFFSCLPHMW